MYNPIVMLIGMENEQFPHSLAEPMAHLQDHQNLVSESSVEPNTGVFWKQRVRILLRGTKNIANQHLSALPKKIEHISTVAAFPLESFSRVSTNSLLTLLEKARQIGINQRQQPWEKWYSNQEIGDTISQKEMVKLWLADSFFPTDVLKEIDTILPGFYLVWNNIINSIVAELIDSPAKTISNTFINSLLEGILISNPSSATLLLALRSSLTFLDSKITMTAANPNSIYASKQALVQDFEAFLDLLPQSYDTDAAFLINRLVDDFLKNIDYSIKKAELAGTYAGYTTGVFLTNLHLKGIIGLVDTAVTVTSLFFVNIAVLSVQKILDPLARAYSQNAAQLGVIREEKRKAIDYEHTMEIDQALLDGIEKWVEITKQKNIAGKAITDIFIISAANILYLLQATPSWVSGMYMATKTTRGASQLNDSYIARQKTKENRILAVQELHALIEKLLADEWIFLTNSVEQSTKKRINLSDPPEITIKFIAIPEIITKDGVEKNSMTCEEETSLESGKMTAIVGKNGSGKTTVAKTMAGITSGRPAEHDILINRHPSTEYDAHELKRTFVFLENEPKMNLRREVALLLRTYSNTIIPDGKTVSKSEIKKWYLKKESSFNDEWISRYISQKVAYINKKYNKSFSFTFKTEWLNGQQPSGLERATLKLLLALSITEHPVIIFDQPESEGTKESFEFLIACIDELMEDNKHVIIIANQYIEKWLAHPNLNATIDMNQEEIQGRKGGVSLEKLDQNPDLHAQVMLALRERYQEKREVSAQEYLYIVQEVKNTFIKDNFKNIYAVGKTEGKIKIKRRESGITDYENNAFAYLEKYIVGWIEKLDPTPENIIFILEILSVSYIGIQDLPVSFTLKKRASFTDHAYIPMKITPREPSRDYEDPWLATDYNNWSFDTGEIVTKFIENYPRLFELKARIFMENMHLRTEETNEITEADIKYMKLILNLSHHLDLPCFQNFRKNQNFIHYLKPTTDDRIDFEDEPAF